MRQKKGFTLIELLVVISIIAILLAILMPGLKKAKQVARDTICRSNLKQWGIIWNIYANENEGKLPDCTGFGALRGDWIVALRSDYPTGKITTCPNAEKFVEYNNPANDAGGTFSAYKNFISQSDGTTIEELCSYGMNNWVYSTSHWAMGGDANNKIWKSFENAGSYAYNVPLFMDSAFRGGFPQYDSFYDEIKMKPSDSIEPPADNGFERVMHGIRQFAMPRHKSGSNAGINVVFMDASARPVKVKEMWSLKWHQKFDTTRWRTDRDEIWPAAWMDNLSEDF